MATIITHYRELRLSHLSPFPEIVPMIEASLALDSPELYQELSDEMLLAIQAALPVHAVKVEGERAQYEFFAGWQLLHELRRREVAKVLVVVHSSTPPDVMERAMMMELGALALGTLNAQLQPYAFQLLREHSSLWPKIFSGHRPRTPATALQRLCGLSRAAAQRIATPSRRSAQQSTLEKILAKELNDSVPDIDNAVSATKSASCRADPRGGYCPTLS